MSKADFFRQLQERLRGLPYEERQRIVRVYEDLFRQAEDSGRTEQEIIASLGYAPVPVSAPDGRSLYRGGGSARSAENGLRTAMAAISLGLFNLIFVLGPFVGVSAVLFVLSLVALLFTFSTIWIIIGTGIPATLSLLLTEVFTALFLTGTGILMGIGLCKVNRGYLLLIKRYIRLNLRLIKGE